MALNKVTDALQDFEEEIIVNIPEKGSRDHGMWVDGEINSHEIEANIQPMGDQEQNQINPDGDTSLSHRKFYIDVEKYPLDIATAHDSKKAVTITYLGKNYKTLKVKNYAVLGGYQLIYAVETRQETIYAQ